MKSNKRAMRNLQRNDEAVSPVIAVILMVAITVVLAATVYVWVSGFGQSGEQAPAASFKITNCDTDNHDLTIKLLSSSKSLALGDMNFVVTDESDGSSVGSNSSATGTWDVGSSVEVGGIGNLTAGTTYVMDVVHTPSGNIIGSPQYTC